MVFFDPGSAAPTEKSRPALDQFIKGYNQDAQECGRLADIRIFGHADATGSESANLALSMQRSRAIVYMLEQGGLPRERLSVVGVGSRQPLVVLTPQASEQERASAYAQDRRVEIFSRL
jgi:outer membrane protein OmpA-like peptidoglycan-associated protein